MRFDSGRSFLTFLVVLASSLTMGGSLRAESPDGPFLRDDFDSKLALDWDVLRPDPSHVSLKSHPGRLTITTQYGSINGSQTTAKNLFFVDVPKGMENFVATTCVEDFLPETIWQQAGLMFYNDDDNFIKWVRDYAGHGYPILNVNMEQDRQGSGAQAPIEFPKERFWLRVIKRGSTFQCLASTDDGKTWTTYFVMPWRDGSLKKLGLVAKNGPREGDLPAQFDFFELRQPTQAELDDPVYEIRRDLLGEWTAVERRVNGKPLTKGPATSLIVEPGTMRLKEKQSLVLSYTIDPNVSPNRMTFIPRAYGLGRLFHGVYSLDGETLTIRVNPEVNGAPPASLEPEEDDGYLYMKFERNGGTE